MDAGMALAAALFFVLFGFLLFVFGVYLCSLFVRRSFQAYTPCITVMVPTHNEEKNIAGCLDAILASDYPRKKMDVVVVDDGSTDRTRDIVGRYAGVRLLPQKHLGKSKAMTRGAKNAAHDFVISIDADTIISRRCIRELVKPMQHENIGATTGVSTVRNVKSLLGMFQNIEYHYNNLIRNSFTLVFNNGIWFFGAVACYRKTALQRVGYFKTDTLTEDMDIALELRRAGYKTYNVREANSNTIVPETLSAFYRQRSRWWLGVLQSLVKNKVLFSRKTSPSILFLYVNQFWWSFYSIVSLPLIIYQVAYWLPYNTETTGMLAGYLFRWFSLSGPFYVLYKIPEWGFSMYSAFGVLAGIISAVMILASIRLFKDERHIGNAFALFFYFPYTIVLNMITFISLLHFKTLKNKFFLK